MVHAPVLLRIAIRRVLSRALRSSLLRPSLTMIGEGSRARCRLLPPSLGPMKPGRRLLPPHSLHPLRHVLRAITVSPPWTTGDPSGCRWRSPDERDRGRTSGGVSFSSRKTDTRSSVTGLRHESTTTAMRDLGTGSIAKRASTHEAETSRAARSPPDDRNYPSVLDLRLRAGRSLASRANFSLALR